MYTVKEMTSAGFREKGSKFIGYLMPAESRKEFEDKLRQIRSKHPDATHHCYAWRIGPDKTDEFRQDDGEPGGTAGSPILNRLKSYDMINCGLIVVRYYGGTDLGKSGLIGAYGDAAGLCLEKASLLKLIPTKNFKITFPYDRQTEIDRLTNNYGLKELEAEYLEKVTLSVACRSVRASSFFNRIKKMDHLDIEVEKTGNGYITFTAK